MSEPAYVAPKPCNTCPYLRSTPAGIWHPDEYRKLPLYDNDLNPETHIFHCHQQMVTGRPTLCRGWLGVHPDSIAVRLGMALRIIDPTDVLAIPDSDPTLYASGTEACEAGLAGCDDPDDDARAAMDRLLRRGEFRVG